MGSISEKTASADTRRERPGTTDAHGVKRDHAGFGPLALPAVVAAAHMASRSRRAGTEPGAGC